MAKFHIQPHGRLTEWVADELGFFKDEGLDYVFERSTGYDERRPKGAPEIKSGAFESYKAGKGNKGAEVRSDISCACHWAVNEAATEKVGHLYREAYVATPGGVMVRPDSRIQKPEDLAKVGIAVGYHSGSHFTTIQALEAFLPAEQIELKFVGGPMKRLDAIFDGDVEASSVWGMSYQILEQLGFRKIVDTSFMITFMFPDGTDPRDVEKYMRALKRAQAEVDLHPERYKKFYLNEMPDRFKGLVDVRRFSTGERVIFLPYTDQTLEMTQSWMKERNLFAADTAAA